MILSHRAAPGAALLALLCFSATSCTQNMTQEKAADGDSTASTASAADPVERGKYLVTITGCHDCHTPGTFYGAPDMSRQLSGSEVGWRGPWGVSYAPNLTPDSTGLGTWTDEQILNAVQRGVNRAGAPIAPPMPWPSFAHLTPEDARAIVAYLRSVPPVRHVMPARVPPGGRASGSIIDFPPAPAWDKPQKPAS